MAHGIITNGPILCKICKENYDIKNGLKKRTTNRKNKYCAKMSCHICKFHKVNYQSMLNKYA